MRILTMALALTGILALIVPVQAVQQGVSSPVQAVQQGVSGPLCRIVKAGAADPEIRVAQGPACAVGTKTLPSGAIACATACGLHKSNTLAQQGFPYIHFQGSFAECAAWRAAHAC